MSTSQSLPHSTDLADRIEGKYTKQIERATRDTKTFWSKKNVQKLEGFYDVWKRDLSEHNLDASKPLNEFSHTLRAILESQTELSSDPILRSKLLSNVEIENLITEYEAKKIHELFIKQLQKSEEEESVRNTKIQSSFSAMSQNPFLPIEKDSHFLSLNLENINTLQEIDNRMGPILSKKELCFEEFSMVQKGFEEKVSLLKRKGLSALTVYRNWTHTLLNLRHVISQEDFENFKKEEYRVHAKAHQEAIEANLLYSPTAPLEKADLTSLFKAPLKPNEVIYYCSKSNLFKKELIEKYLFSKQEMAETVKQIQNLFMLLLSKNKKISSQVTEIMGAEFSYSAAIKRLLNILEKTESTFPKVKRVRENLHKELVRLIKSQIEGAILHAKNESIKQTQGTLQLSSLFEKDTAAHFYLKLAQDLEIIPFVVPKNFSEKAILGLINPSKELSSFGSERAILEKLAVNPKQKEALGKYFNIKDLNEKIIKNPILKSTYEEGLEKEKASFDLIIREQTIEAVKEIAKIKDQNFKKESTSKEIAEIVSRLTESFSIEEFIQKHLDALFFIDIAHRGHSELFTNLNSLQIAFLNKITSHYRLHSQKILLATRNKTNLSDLVNNTKDVQKLKSSFIDMLLFGLRSYNNMFARISTYLDWSEVKPGQEHTHLEEAFIQHLIRLQAAENKKIDLTKIKRFPKEACSDIKALLPPTEKTIQEAKELAKEFTALLEPYRTIQKKLYKFYDALAVLLIGKGGYLNLPVLTQEDIDLIVKNASSINEINFYNIDERKIAQKVEKNADAIKKLIAETQVEQQASAFYSFLTKPNEKSGVNLITEGISYSKIKLLAKTIQIIKLGEEIQSINITEIQELFNEPNSFWRQFGHQTQAANLDKIEIKLENFVNENHLELMRFFTDLLPQNEKECEYFSHDPFRMAILSINTFSKWNIFKADLEKRLKEDHVEVISKAIRDVSTKMNRNVKLASSFKQKQSSRNLSRVLSAQTDK